MKKLLAVAVVIASLSSVSFAKVTKGEERYGLGYTMQPAGASAVLNAVSLNAVSFRYWQKGEMGLEAFLGYFSYDNSTNGSGIGAKFLKPMKDEQNLTAYWFGMLTLINGSVAGTSASGTVIGAGLGVEFFLDGLPNLGFSAEIGISNRGGDAFAGTKGTDINANPLSNAGVRYYFK